MTLNYKPELNIIIFGSKNRMQYLEDIETSLLEYPTKNISIKTQRWDYPGVFSPLNKKENLSLFEFLNNIHLYDAAILLLGRHEDNENDQHKRANDENFDKIRENLLIETGACLNKFGRKRVFLLTDEGLDIPSYLREALYEEGESKILSTEKAFASDLHNKRITAHEIFVKPILNKGNSPKEIEDTQKKIKVACKEIMDSLIELQEVVFFSDLPALGLANGYFYNFVMGALYGIKNKWLSFCKVSEEATKPIKIDYDKIKFHILVPHNFLSREESDAELVKNKKIHEYLLSAPKGQGRDISFHGVMNREGFLHIFDFPTTLIVSKKIIESVNSLYNMSNSREFSEREARNFSVMIKYLVENKENRHPTNKFALKTGDINEIQSYISEICQ